ncbi:MAG: deoxyribodipyrimidine photolyase, partial [Deltaproteobacteria bacterium]|nr:deoxyribodipyrimidine photolyase [Deltaproteobacteria bacterium]
MQSVVPESRLHVLSDHPPNLQGDFVVYWMSAFRRLAFNFALDRAVEWSARLKKPLVIFEPLRVDYPYACDRFHRFIIDGMIEKASELSEKGVFYFPFVERDHREAKKIWASLVSCAAVVVGDASPAFFFPHMQKKAASLLHEWGIRFEAVDSCGLIPLRITPHAFASAFECRRFAQKVLPKHLEAFPSSDPLACEWVRCNSHPLPPFLEEVRQSQLDAIRQPESLVASLPVDHSVSALTIRGGSRPARERLKAFLRRGILSYAENRHHPDEEASSGLS